MGDKWIAAANSAVQALQVGAAVALPSLVAMGPPTLTSCHDQTSVSKADLNGTLQAWHAKYAMPAQAVSALSALVVAESVDYQSTHIAIRSGNGDLEVVAAAGRNWNNQVSVAFVYGTVSANVITHFA